jgi:sporulation protein YunB
MFYSIFYMAQVVRPSIASVGEMKARAMLSQTVNTVIKDTFAEEINTRELLEIRVDESGRVTLVQADSVAMTQLSYALADKVQDRIKSMKEEEVLVPIGTILGSPILSQTGPKIRVKVLPLGTTKIGFKTELEEAGINQTKYKVYLEIINQAKVLVPFSANDIKVETVLLVAEAVILGEMPQSYIYVPKEDILDAIN